MPTTSIDPVVASVPEASRPMGLLLVAATARGDAAARAWEAWLRAVDFENLEDGATALLSLVARNVGDLGAEPSIEARVRGVQRQTWARNRLLWAAGAPLLDRLDAVAGRPLLLPPSARLAAFDGDWGARPLERIVVALHPSAADAARGALADTGWEVDHLTPALLARTRAGIEERWQSQDPAGNWVTLRWHILRSVRSAVADEQLRGAARSATIAPATVHLLHPADALLERLWCGAGERGPGWIADAVQLARGLDDVTGARPEVGRFATRARELAILPVLQRRLELVASTVPDPAVLAALDALRSTRPVPASVLWDLPGPAARRGRVLAGHAAGQGVLGGARSLARSRRAARRLRSGVGLSSRPTAGSSGPLYGLRGSAQRR